MWQRAAINECLEALDTLWSCAKEEEINIDEMFLAQTGNGYTAFQLAPENNNLDTLQKMWVWAE